VNENSPLDIELSLHPQENPISRSIFRTMRPRNKCFAAEEPQIQADNFWKPF